MTPETKLTFVIGGLLIFCVAVYCLAGYGLYELLR